MISHKRGHSKVNHIMKSDSHGSAYNPTHLFNGRKFSFCNFPQWFEGSSRPSRLTIKLKILHDSIHSISIRIEIIIGKFVYGPQAHNDGNHYAKTEATYIQGPYYLLLVEISNKLFHWVNRSFLSYSRLSGIKDKT